MLLRSRSGHALPSWPQRAGLAWPYPVGCAVRLHDGLARVVISRSGARSRASVRVRARPALHASRSPSAVWRRARTYVRQPSLAQRRTQTASTARQYDLGQRALALGWPREHIHVVDQDQGVSGASAVGRDGFQALVAEVGLGHAGAVLSLEVSRLARSSSDWYRLLEICALADTLVIDEEGIYDPGQYNDRLLLGFKGTMSEAELHWLKQRLQGGLRAKARQGTLRLPLPTGLVYDP